MRALAALLLVSSSCLAACADDSGPDTGCEMQVMAALPVLNDQGSPIVPATINGTKVALVLDTGAHFSFIFKEAADRLGLPVDDDKFHMMGGVGGKMFTSIVTVDTLSLGSLTSHRQDFDSVAIDKEWSVQGLPVAGLLGGDFLVNYDVQFDLPDHLVKLYTERHCSGNLRPWAQGDFYRLSFEAHDETGISLDITVNGHTEPVILDSGATRTIIDSNAGRETGATRSTMVRDRQSIAHGLDGNAVEAHRHRFDSLDIGPEHFAPAFLDVGNIDVEGLLGADFFRARKVWISYPHQVLYVQRVLFPHADAPASGGSASAAGQPKH